MTKVSIIAAIGRNFEIGKDNDLLWHLPKDMKFFKDQTLHHPIIMGRKNYESIPERFRPFKDRMNIVVSRQGDYEAPGCFLFQDFAEAVEFAKEHDEEEVFIIGGAEIYKESLRLNLVDQLYITHVDAHFPEAHSFFPNIDFDQWNKKILFTQEKDEKHLYAFEVFFYEKTI
jgi:dihydrofolate reductase